MEITGKSILLTLISVFILFHKPIRAGGQNASDGYPLAVLITEILYDPDPVIGLPECEYIELYNNSPDTINLLHWNIKVGSKDVSIPGHRLNPGAFAVLVSDNCQTDFDGFDIDLVTLDKWAALRNGGQNLTLLSPGGQIIHFAVYHPMMIEDPLKRDGGWSLELADLSSPCNQAAWEQSDDVRGGTPGRPNSRVIQIDDNRPAEAVRAGVPDINRLIIHFDEPLLPYTYPGWLDFATDQACPEITGWSYYEWRPDRVEVFLDGFIPSGQVFEISISGEATDCQGNSIKEGKVHFGVPEAPLEGDLLISEIMFDPLEHQEEFIEIYNASGKVLAINDLYVATLDLSGGIKSFSKPEDESFLMFPGNYYVVTPDLFKTDQAWDDIPAGHVYQREDLPSLSNEGSGIVIMDRGQIVLDSARYDPEWYDSRFGDLKGFSLERISFDMDGMLESNWHIASLASGGSTPGLSNSQQSFRTGADNIFWFDSRAFRAGGDNHHSYLLINADTGEAGWVGNASVWSLSGNRIKELAGPSILPSRGAFKWDGTDENGRMVPPGYYIIIINYIRPDGSKGRWKDACLVLAH